MTLGLSHIYECMVSVCVCVCVCTIATRLTPHPVCVSLPSAVCLLRGPCPSLTKRGYLCPLFTAEERDTAHPPVPPRPAPPLLSTLYLCVSSCPSSSAPLIFFPFIRVDTTTQVDSMPGTFSSRWPALHGAFFIVRDVELFCV